MTYEEVYKSVVNSLDRYDVTNLKTISDIIDLHNDRLELDRLSSVYSDYVSLCHSTEFDRIKVKYCI